MHSVDNLYGARWDKTVDNGALSPPPTFDAKMGRITPAEWSFHSTETAVDELKRPVVHQGSNLSLRSETSKWIHRDKLAKIENDELHAAGIFVEAPRSRAPSKQRRDRSTRRNTDASDHNQNRPRNDSATLEALDTSGPSWDLRTPEEIAEAEANAYFTSNGHYGGTRIPVAKASPAPIPLDYLERGTTALRKHTESPENQAITHPKTRSRSASASFRDPSHHAVTPGGHRPGQRSVTDFSPKKPGPASRKTSASSKTSTTPNRPKTRSGPSRDSPGSTSTRPPTRSGEGSITKHVEGDPPWLVNSYRPDPRLPQDQQLLPTVARRLQQEKWEKEGKFGDIYDTDFRPLNDKSMLKAPEPPVPENAPTTTTEEETQHNQSGDWPLKTGAPPARSPPIRQGSYSTMPKMSGKPPVSPIPSPRTPVTPYTMTQEQHDAIQPIQTMPDRQDDDEKKGGCGCCVVM